MATPLLSPKFYAWDPRTGKPLAFGKVHTYESESSSGGTSQPKATFKNPGATAYNTNPVVLNAAGFADIYLNGTYKIIVTAADGYVVWEADPVTDISRIAEEWIYPTEAVYVSPTEFKVTGSMTDIFVVGRALKLSDSMTIYGTVAASYYSSGETFVTIYSSEPITASLSQASVGLISSDPSGTLSENIAMTGGSKLHGRGSALYRVNGIEGGSDDYLDGIDGDSGGPVVNNAATALASGDIAIVTNPSDGAPEFDVFVMDETRGGNASPPDVIAPVSNPGDKRWVKVFGKALIQQIIRNVVYPVGAPYISFTDNRNPLAILGFGTWVRVAGQTLVGYDSEQAEFNEILKTGGAKSVTLTAAQSGMREHGHGASSSSSTSVTLTDSGHAHLVDNTRPSSGYRAGDNVQISLGGAETIWSHNSTSNITASASTSTSTTVQNAAAQNASDSHTNLQPYMVAYIWRRTA